MPVQNQKLGVPRWLAAGIMLLCSIAILLIVCSSKAAAATADKPIEVWLDEKQIVFEKDPVAASGTVLVQFRPLFEAMGIKVSWDSKQQTITGTKEGFLLKMKLNSKQATVNGEVVNLAQPPQAISGNTMVPIRFVSESTGALVAWNPYKPQIVIYTEAFLQELGITKEAAKEVLDTMMAKLKEEWEAAHPGQTKPTAPAVKPGTVPAVPKGSGEYKPAVSDAVDLTKLQGMYYGLRMDVGGYECGGACWDLYTFLPGNKVVVGNPVNGGPETIDCKKDKCSTYSIKNGKMTLSNGDSYTIAKKDGMLIINDVELERVKPVTGELKLSQEYIYRGYSGMVGINSASSAWSKTIVFSKDGTFQSDDMALGTVEGAGTTNTASGSKANGAYRISGNTIVLAYEGGKVETLLFFVHNSSKRGALGDIQIGENNFYIDSE
ncbi:copper amine oxidase N-terminal domain-containing protein [Paenibacillus sp. GCM10027626]|uniref:copper amine oxidase N-terminal domain-containing protein n=1 Tax=Paenibacillus sp. GCM10027626 TaxID=3273411 RepID=UPI0036308E4F